MPSPGNGRESKVVGAVLIDISRPRPRPFFLTFNFATVELGTAINRGIKVANLGRKRLEGMVFLPTHKSFLLTALGLND